MLSQFRSLLLASTAATLLLTTVTACGDDSASTGDTHTAKSTDPGDYSAPITVGDDLLDEKAWGTSSPGAKNELRVRFPQTYDTDGNSSSSPFQQDADAKDGSTTYQISAVAASSRRYGSLDKMAATFVKSGNKTGATTATSETTINGRKFTILSQDDHGSSTRMFLHEEPGDTAVYTVSFMTNTPLDQTSDKRLEELDQTVGALELEPADATTP